jgi:hypothetical protein
LRIYNCPGDVSFKKNNLSRSEEHEFPKKRRHEAASGKKSVCEEASFVKLRNETQKIRVFVAGETNHSMCQLFKKSSNFIKKQTKDNAENSEHEVCKIGEKKNSFNVKQGSYVFTLSGFRMGDLNIDSTMQQ